MPDSVIASYNFSADLKSRSSRLLIANAIWRAAFSRRLSKPVLSDLKRFETLELTAFSSAQIASTERIARGQVVAILQSMSAQCLQCMCVLVMHVVSYIDTPCQAMTDNCV